MKILEMIKKIRTEMKLTQSELAELLGVTQHTISQWETGKRQIDYVSFEKLLELSNRTLTLENRQPIHPIQEVGTQEDVTFYRDQANQLYQRLANYPYFLTVVHERTDIFIDSIYDYVIKYDLSAQCGFSVWDEDEETCFFEGLWSLREVEEEIHDTLPLYCGHCGEELDGFFPCETCHELICPSCEEEPCPDSSED